MESTLPRLYLHCSHPLHSSECHPVAAETKCMLETSSAEESVCQDYFKSFSLLKFLLHCISRMSSSSY